MSDNYEKVCKQRFDQFDTRLGNIEEVTGDIREKVFDGFGKSIEHIEDKIKTIQTLVISVIILGGFSILVAIFITVIRMTL